MGGEDDDLARQDTALRRRLQQLSPSAEGVPPVTSATRDLLRAKLHRLERAAEAKAKIDSGPSASESTASKEESSKEPSSSSARPPVSTLVFLDLEATGLADSK